MDGGTLERLASRADIAELLLRYCRAVDRRDGELMRSCFHDDAMYRHGAFDGTAADFCADALDRLEKLLLTHHQSGSAAIAFETADVAHTEVYFTSFAAFGPVPPPGGRPNEDRTLAGRYIDRVERRAGVWRIAARRGINEWVRYESRSDGDFGSLPEDQRGRRDRSDPIYQTLLGSIF